MHAHMLCSWHSVLPVQFETSAAKLSTTLERQVWTGCLVERAGNLVTVFLHYTGEQVRLHRHGEAQTGSPLISLLQLVCETWHYVNKQING